MRSERSASALPHKRESSLGGDTVRLTVSKILTLCITTATVMLLSRFRTKEEYGTYSQLLLVINLFVSLLMLGLPSSINFFLARAETQEEKRRFLSVYYTLSTLLSLLIGGLMVLSIPLIEAYFHNPLIRSFWYFLALYPWANIVSSSVENILVVFRRTGLLMVYRVLHSAAMLGAVLIVQWLGLGFREYTLAFIVTNLAFTFFTYWLAARLGGGLRPLIDGKQIRALFAFSVPIGLAAAVGTLNTEIDKLLIGYLMDTEQLAVYTNAAKELPFTVVAASITAVLLPQLTRMVKKDQTREAVALWGTATELSFLIIALIVSGVFAYAEEVMTILYSAKYLPGVSVFRVYTLNLLLRCTYFGILLNACGDTKKIFYCSVLSLVLNAVLNPLFYWVFGMIGPAIATFLAILLIQLLQLRMTAKKTGVRFAEVFPWKRAAVILLINLVFALVFRALRQLLPLDRVIGSVGEAVALGAVWSAAYLYLMRARLKTLWRGLNGKQSLIPERERT